MPPLTLGQWKKLWLDLLAASSPRPDDAALREDREVEWLESIPVMGEGSL